MKWGHVSYQPQLLKIFKEDDSDADNVDNTSAEENNVEIKLNQLVKGDEEGNQEEGHQVEVCAHEVFGESQEILTGKLKRKK
ncbi:hypothetical protein EVAR_29988_1 [Eumeta japonica]|uniref:Uncharacterized protein n=1 Tax=Eumeta variegata TaxID=151549 RepID=A0A4C1VFY1_EUMVA|nr:hypothetical protein EVAR_29988_1 [Eumeta japonica]